MFEQAASVDGGGDDLARLGVAETASAAAECVQAKQAAGCRLLEYAAHWADLHPGDGLPLADKINIHGSERVLTLGGDGTPDVAEFAPATLGLEIRKSSREARALIADALDLRHRLPFSWKQVRGARIPAKAARRLAFRTRALTQQQAELVDQRIVGKLATVTGRRLDDLITAEISRVDRDRQEREAVAAAVTAFVQFEQPDGHGMVDFSGRTHAPDAQRVDASLTRLAIILQAHPDDLKGTVATHGAHTLKQWRDVAHTLFITNPVLATQLLLQDQQPGLFGSTTAAEDPTREVADPDDRDASDSSRSDCVDVDVDQALLLALIKKINPVKLAPTSILHVHISRDVLAEFANGAASVDAGEADSAVARVERIGPTLLNTVRDWLGGGCKVKLQPILDADNVAPVDAYETPDRLRDAVLAHLPASSFPWSGSRSRHNDLDHTPSYRPPPTGPPGQTSTRTLGPLNRAEHRYRTHGPVRVKQPVPGTRVWRTRFGRVLITNAAGTHDLGTNRFADAVWASSATPL